MSKLSKEQFDAYLEQIKELAEGPFEEMQPEIEVTNVFPEKFYELAKENDLYRFALPAEYGGWDLSELDILRVQEQFSRGPGGMRMHLHYAADLNWRILDDYGSDELKAQYMDKFQDKTIFTNSLLPRRLVALVLTCTPPQFGTKRRANGSSMVKSGSSPTPTALSSLTLSA